MREDRPVSPRFTGRRPKPPPVDREPDAPRRPVAGSDREYAADELEFLKACEAHRAKVGRKFLTACEYLFVAKALGYRREEV